MFDTKKPSRGIIRNKIIELNQAKGRQKAPIKRFSKAALRKTIQEESIVKSSLLSQETKSSQIEMTFIQEPFWMGDYKDCCALLKEVQFIQGEISKENLKKMSAVRQDKHDRVIQQFTGEATAKLNRCEKKLKDMEKSVSFDTEMTPAQRRGFTSMVMSMATNIRDQARKLRSNQQKELKRERELKDSAKNILQFKTDVSETESWLSQQDFQDMQKQMIKERNDQATKILQSIYSLNQIYKDLQTLVIEQGSILDRIDSNIQNTVQSISTARKHLEEANQKMDSACFKRTRKILIFFIGIMLLIFFIKHV